MDIWVKQLGGGDIWVKQLGGGDIGFIKVNRYVPPTTVSDLIIK